jgi:hypothetical protein
MELKCTTVYFHDSDLQKGLLQIISGRNGMKSTADQNNP